MLGRLYWSEHQVLHSDVNAMAAALREHQALLLSIFGGGGDDPRHSYRPVRRDDILRADERAPPLTPSMFDVMFSPRRRKQ